MNLQKNILYRIANYFIVILSFHLISCTASIEKNNIQTNELESKKHASETAFDFRKSGEENLRIGKYRAAILKFTKALEIVPSYEQAYFGRAWAYYKTLQYKLSMEDYDEIINLSPNRYEAYGERAIVYKKMKKYKLALEGYARSLQLNPAQSGVHVSRGFLFRDLNKMELACKDWENACEKESKNACRKLKGDCFGIDYKNAKPDEFVYEGD